MTPKFTPLKEERLGPLLRRRMKELNLRPCDVAVAIGYRSTHSVYSWIEGRNIPRDNALYRLSEVLEIPEEEIFIAASETAIGKPNEAWRYVRGPQPYERTLRRRRSPDKKLELLRGYGIPLASWQET